MILYMVYRLVSQILGDAFFPPPHSCEINASRLFRPRMAAVSSTSIHIDERWDEDIGRLLIFPMMYRARSRTIRRYSASANAAAWSAFDLAARLEIDEIKDATESKTPGALLYARSLNSLLSRFAWIPRWTRAEKKWKRSMAASAVSLYRYPSRTLSSTVCLPAANRGIRSFLLLRLRLRVGKWSIYVSRFERKIDLSLDLT